MTDSPTTQRQTLLQKYHQKLIERLANARANNREEARRKALADRGCVSPLGGVAKPAKEKRA